MTTDKKPTTSASSSSSSPFRIIFIVVSSLLGILVAFMLRGFTPSQLLSSFTGASRALSTKPARASGLIATSGIELLTFGTPNGHKVSILLEELKDAYGRNYTWQSVPINENVQKETWYTKLNPNGKIPTIVDHDNGGFAVFEGAAILAYLTRKYDPQYKFSFKYDSNDFSTCEQWIAWQHGGLGPVLGQANHFFRLAKESVPYGIQRYLGESERLLGVLDARLANRDYIVGPGRGKYATADIASFSWLKGARFIGLDMQQWPNVDAWVKRIEERPAVKRGISIPSESKFLNSLYDAKLASDPKFKEKEAELMRAANVSKEKYGYKYASP